MTMRVLRKLEYNRGSCWLPKRQGRWNRAEEKHGKMAVELSRQAQVGSPLSDMMLAYRAPATNEETDGQY